MLSSRIEHPVKFSEVDSLRVVWHGHYVRYFEDGREAFGKEHQLGYLDMYKHGLAVPLVDLQVNYKRILEYGDSAVIETTLILSPAAKLIFEYTIRSAMHGHIVCTGRSVQVFMNPHTKELQLTVPEFFEAWKKERNLS
ncbi:MAG: acyl-CoA thioesterase [Bacteroidetes bacterium]|nr:acyl-CoA thioesterase [Bacteroidota bacterium]